MQDGSTVVSVRSEHRYQIDDIASTRVRVEVSTAAGEPLIYEGFLSDLSFSGVRLILPEKLLPGQQVSVRLTLSAIDLDVTRDATVCWSDPRDGESWWVGCSLQEPLDDSIIDRMAVAKVVDRRRDTRYSTSRAALARWELSDEILNVQIVNYSKGGFCIVSSRATSSEATSCSSERVMLLIEDVDRQVKIPARVMWHRPTEGGHAFGCSFTTRDGFVRLCELVQPGWTSRKKFRHGAAIPRHRVTRWVVLVVAVLLAAEFMQLAGGRPRLWQTTRRAFLSKVLQPLQQGVMHAWYGEADEDRSEVGR